jgi:hypothetical protein
MNTTKFIDAQQAKDMHHWSFNVLIVHYILQQCAFVRCCMRDVLYVYFQMYIIHRTVYFRGKCLHMHSGGVLPEPRPSHPISSLTFSRVFPNFQSNLHG